MSTGTRTHHEAGLPDAASVAAASFDRMWADLAPIGRDGRTGGYRRFAWTREDALLREWFAAQAETRGLDLVEDRAGNQWAWWGDPDAVRPDGTTGGVAVGSHLDSVPDGGAFDGPLGVVSAFAAVDALRATGFAPDRPLAVVNFGDEEGARFGIACAGSRLITGALTAERALGLRDADGVTMAEALRAAGRDPHHLGRDDETLGRVREFVELHVEQGRALADPEAYDQDTAAVAVGSDIWPHGRWRLDVAGTANHAGTTRLEDRDDAMIGHATMVLAARRVAAARGCVATMGKVRVEPNGVNAIASHVTGWLDVRGPDEHAVRAVVDDLMAKAGEHHATLVEESWTGTTRFDPRLVDRLAATLGAATLGAATLGAATLGAATLGAATLGAATLRAGTLEAGTRAAVPILGTGAGHDAGILAAHGIPAAMLFVRNPTGVSHSPAEHADRNDCLAGIAALARVAADLINRDNLTDVIGRDR